VLRALPPTLRGDLFGGLTATVVGLPVALGFGVASGMGAAAGLYGAVAVGFFASLFGGTRSQISGPTGPMTLAMAVVFTSHASTLPEAMAIVVLAGLIQIGLGLTKVGRFAGYTPHLVVSGFMSGIGVTIVLTQLMPMIGQPATGGGAVGVLRALPGALPLADQGALTVGLCTAAVAFFWPTRISRYLPAPLAALLIGTAVGLVYPAPVPTIGTVPAGIPALPWYEIPEAGFLVSAIQPALIIAILGSVDALLTSLVADSLTASRHDGNRELVGQGIGNVVAGLIGGLPGSGSTVGTISNIRAGGRTRASGMLCAAALLVLALGMGNAVSVVPLAALAGVLIRVGWDIIDWRLLRRIHRIRGEHLAVMLVTLLLAVTVDLITAVAIGLIAAGFAHARQIEHLELDSVLSIPILDMVFFQQEDPWATVDPFQARVGMVALTGSFTVASSNRLISVIVPDIQAHDVVVFDFSRTTYVDDSAAMVLERLFEAAGKARTHCIVMGLRGAPAKTLRGLGVLGVVRPSHVVDTPDQARHLARGLLEPRGS